MSVGAEREFLPTLRALERELPVPLPERLSILRELEYDLEELRGRLEGEGMPSEQARARALEILAPDGPTLRELGRLHTPLYVRLTRGLRGDRLRVLERSALALAAATVLVIEARLLLRADLLRAPSPFLWLVLALGALLFAAIVCKAFELWIRRDHRAPERGLGPILTLAAAMPLAGAVGSFVELYRLVSGFEASSGASSAAALAWLIRSSSLMAVALLFAMTGALAWFFITHWLALVIGARRDLLGDRTETALVHSNTR